VASSSRSALRQHRHLWRKSLASASNASATHARAELNDWLAHKVTPNVRATRLAVTEDVMFEWRLLVADGRKAGHTYSHPTSSSPQRRFITA